ncbi:anti-sigma factor family protein [Streptomyces fumanus]|uniref:anti-sigma factor family protein n=1 Tax=Streptomyces fumanus TaxID=67302 RepID=UPI0033F2A7ED
MAGHPDVTEISDLTEGLLPPSRSAAVRRHLDACELCAEVHASLEEIRGLLGTLPGPQRIPEDVAGRIDAALAAEALLNATAPEPANTAAPGTSGAGPDGDSRAHVSRETSPPAGRPRATTTGPGRKNRTRTGRRRIAALGAVFAAAALGLGSVIVASVQDSGSPGSGQRATRTDTFSEGRLERQVSDLLSHDRTVQGGRTAQTSGTEGGAENRLFTRAAVPECVQQGIGRDDAALAVEEGVFQGRDALLVVLPDASDDSRVTVYIVEATCVGQPSSGKAEVLLKHSYRRS